MSTGYSLRNLLDDEKVYSALNNFNGYNDNSSIHKTVAFSNHQLALQAGVGVKKDIAQWDNKVNASLQLRDVAWSNNGNGDFDLEYMDLDEFLNETGLADTNFSQLPVASPSSSDSIDYSVDPTTTPQGNTGIQSPLEQPCTPLSSLEQLLLKGSSSLDSSPNPYYPFTPQPCENNQLVGNQLSPVSVGQLSQTSNCQRRSPSTTNQLSPTAVHQQSPTFVHQQSPTSVGQRSPTSFSQQSPASISPQSPASVSQPSPAVSQQSSLDSEPSGKNDAATAENVSKLAIIKKRKYSENGTGLTDTAVVVVPGQEGFDPAHAKFTPEDLQPQPIIKKSRKQFVADDSKDEKYWKRRNKNNVAAKRSREARRAKENQIIMRAGFLESENSRLTTENSQLQFENKRLQALLKK